MKRIKTMMIAAIMLLNLQVFAQSEADAFIGHWALHLPGGAGWLGVTQENGHLDASILWRGGSVLPVNSVYVSQGKLYAVRNIGDAKFGDRTLKVLESYEFEVNGNQLIGKRRAPKKDGTGADVTIFSGTKNPALPAKPNLADIQYGKAVKLFNGKDLSGWELMGNNANGWKVEKGVLINDPADHNTRYANIKTSAMYNDFNLKLQVNIPEGSNSGVYLKGIYEVQVVDSYGKDLDSHNMGALYSRVTPTSAQEKKAGEWQEMDITLYKRHLTVKLNGVIIIDNHPVEGVTGGAMTANEFHPGPIYLQGDHGKVLYKDMVLTPILN